MTKIALLGCVVGLILGAGAGCGTLPAGKALGQDGVSQPLRAKDAKLGESLIKALWERDAEQVRSLLAKGASPDTRDAFGYPALLLAAGDGQLDSVVALLEAKADVTVRDPDQRTALMEGAESGVAEIVTALIARGADVRAVDNLKWTALHGAAFYGKADTARALIAAHADITARTDRGKTPDQLADEMGYPDVSRIIRNAGPRIP
jgi:ankyrin repeat protein